MTKQSINLGTQQQNKDIVWDINQPPPAGLPPEIAEMLTNSVMDKEPSTEQPQPISAQAPIPEPTSTQTGLFNTSAECPRCGWNMNQPDIDQPTHLDKQGFLQAILGQKPFIKDYIILGGAVQIRYRTLTTKELDVVYRQVFREQQQGKITTTLDYWEKLSRYRMYLQLSQVTSSAFSYDLPDGYDKASNPHAEAYWQFDPPENPDDTAIPLIEEFIINKVLRNESICRMAHAKCLQFNRLVSKLEVLLDDSDFWQKTEEQS